MDVPGREVGPGTAAPILVLDIDRSTARRWQRGVLALSSLDAGLLVGAQHEVARTQSRILPAPLIEVQDAASLRGKVGIPREDPSAMAPRPQSILAQPAPQCRAADLGDQPLSHRFPAQLRASPSCERQSMTGGQLTGQCLHLNHDTGGKSGPVARRAAIPRDLSVAAYEISCAIYSRVGAACRGERQ